MSDDDSERRNLRDRCHRELVAALLIIPIDDWAEAIAEARDEATRKKVPPSHGRLD